MARPTATLIVNPTSGRGRWGGRVTELVEGAAAGVLRSRYDLTIVRTTASGEDRRVQMGGAGVGSRRGSLVCRSRSSMSDPTLPPRRVAGTGAAEAASAVERGDAVVFVAGGDGTVHDVACGLWAAANAAGRTGDAAPALGILPSGTGNDLAAGLGLPLEDVVLAAHRLIAAKPSPLDVGLVACAPVGGGERGPERPFINICSAGASAGSAALAPRWTPYIGSALGYLLAGIVSAVAALPHAPVVDLTVTHADGRVTRKAVRGPTVIAVASSSTYGGGVAIAPGADAGSGSLHVVVVTPNVVHPFGLGVLRLRRGQHVAYGVDGEWKAAQRGIRVLDGAVHVTADLPSGCTRPVPMEAEGEVIGALPATWRVLPGALRVLR